MTIRFHKNFDRRYRKLPTELQQRFKERSTRFISNPFDAVLRNHMLKGKFKRYRSINIGGDYRAIYKLLEDGTAIFVDIGTHG